MQQNVKRTAAVLALGILLFACNTQGVKKKNLVAGERDVTQKSHSKGKQSMDAKERLKPGKKVSEEKFPNGIRVTWFEKGSGAAVRNEDVVKLNYEVRLQDGTLVDGNQLLNRDWLPFLVGYGMQTKGWDFILPKLHFGDFVEVYLPSEQARGKKGVKGLIPPDAPNILRIRVIERIEPTKIVDGTKVWLLEENTHEKKRAGEEDEVDIHYMVGTTSNPKYDISYRRDAPYTLRFSDFGIVRGLKKGLINAKRSDKLWILIPASEAYGEKGLVDLVKPGESIFYDVFVVDVR